MLPAVAGVVVVDAAAGAAAAAGAWNLRVIENCVWPGVHEAPVVPELDVLVVDVEALDALGFVEDVRFTAVTPSIRRRATMRRATAA